MHPGTPGASFGKTPQSPISTLSSLLILLSLFCLVTESIPEDRSQPGLCCLTANTRRFDDTFWGCSKRRERRPHSTKRTHAKAKHRSAGNRSETTGAARAFRRIERRGSQAAVTGQEEPETRQPELYTESQPTLCRLTSGRLFIEQRNVASASNVASANRRYHSKSLPKALE